MVAFALLRSAGVAGGLASLGGLALVAAAFYVAVQSGRSPARMFGIVPVPRRTWWLAGVGAAIGIALGLGFRRVWMSDVVPHTLTPFVWTALAVGAAEEVLYRGYVQGRLAAALGALPSPMMGEGKGEGDAGNGYAHVPPHPDPLPPGERGTLRLRGFVGIALAILLAAGAHAAYKASLFAWPPEGVAVDYTFLVTWTLIGGAAFGLLRAWGGSVWPALVAHVAFDILAYGDAVRAPWWVWG